MTVGRGALRPACRLCICLACAAVLVQLFPWAQTALQFDRTALAAGQWWRMLTCHLSHWGWSHLAGDISAFVLLWWLAKDRPGAVLRTIPLAAVAVSLAVYWFDAETVVYRGMSGINYALIAYLPASEAIRGRGLSRLGGIGLLGLIAAKVVYELMAGGALDFADIYLPANVATVGAAHAAGLLTGILTALAPPTKRGTVSLNRGQSPIYSHENR